MAGTNLQAWLEEVGEGEGAQGCPCAEQGDWNEMRKDGR